MIAMNIPYKAIPIALDKIGGINDVATAPVGTVLYAVYSAGQEPEPVEPAPDAAA